MKSRAQIGRAGFTLLGVLAALLVLGTIATYLGKRAFFEIRSRQKLEAKTSVIDNESALSEMIAAKLKTLFNSTNPCTFTSATFKTAFNTNPPVFPAPSIPIKIENLSTEPTLAKFKTLTATATAGAQLEIKNAVAGCLDSTKGISVPTTAAPQGVYLFCVALDMTGRTVQRSRGFVFSEAALVQVRIDLMSKSLSQKEKTFGITVGTTTQAAPNCSDWNALTVSDRQVKISYRILWKAPIEDASGGYFSYMGSKMINYTELRSF